MHLRKLNYDLLINWVVRVIVPLFLISIILIPLTYLYMSNDPYFVTNGWDETTYLSTLGSCGLYSPGYFPSSSIVCWLNLNGISGSKIGFYADVLTLTILPILIALSIRNIFDLKKYSFLLAVIFIFSPILFNYGNPLISIFMDPTKYNESFLRVGREPYQPILRGPYPQFSLFYITIFLYIYSLLKKKILLFIPIPFLYFFTAVFYSILLTYMTLYKQIKKRFNKAHLITFFLVWIVASFIWLLLALYLQQPDVLASAKHHYYYSRSPKLPIHVIVPLIGLAIIYISKRQAKKPIQNNYFNIQMTIFATLIIASNMHIINGVSMVSKNYFDYGASFIASASVVVLLLQLKAFSKRGFTLTLVFLLIAISLFTMKSIGWNHSWFPSLTKISVHRGIYPVDKNLLEQAMKTPERAIFTKMALGAKISYVSAGKVSPPLSYQYAFPFYYNICGDMKKYNSDAQKIAEGLLSMSEMTSFAKYSKSITTATSLIKNEDGCDMDLSDRDFFVVKGPYVDNGWVHFSYLEAALGIIKLSVEKLKNR